MKQTTTVITCDACGKDLAVCDSGWDEYRLVLSQESIRNTSNMRYAMDRGRPLESDKHFCSMVCIKAWAA